MQTQNPLEMRGATKWFGNFRAVNSLDFIVPQGSIVGFLGPNGAGKSTSLRMALGVLSPDEGTSHLYGAAPNLDSLKRVGFLPEERGLYKKMSPRQIITYFSRLKGMSAREARKRADEMLDAMGLGPFAKSRVSRLSKGMSQKVQILCALAHRPDFLILDEPFSGLDPVNQMALEELIVEEHKRGATIVFSTHVMEHAERLCEKIVMMARGRKVFDGTLEDGFAALGRAVKIGVAEGFDLAPVMQNAGYESVIDDGEANVWRVSLSPQQDPQHALRAAIDGGAPITSFMPQETRLRDVFVSLVSEAEAQDLTDTLAADARTEKEAA
ncbi:MAG: ATP-binding cassette domain-containing protein [Pseudomonadota bacterium]